jgi:hypothetical protein
LRDTNHTGDISEYAVIARLLQLGKTVLRPIGQKRYDLVIQDGTNFIRAQVKTAWDYHGCVRFSTSSVLRRSSGDTPKAYTADEIDVFLVFFQPINKVYQVPVSVAKKSQMILRLGPSRNNQERGINWATDFEI